jgi:hypothetical protein
MKVRATATMYTDLEWIGDIPDDIPVDQHYQWVKENIGGEQFTELGGDWSYNDVEVEDE